MGLGSTAKKLQKVADIAEDLYAKVTELKTQLQSLQETVEATNDRVDDIDRELADQRALLSALADEQGIDTEAVLDEVSHDDTDADAATADSEPSD